ncbi:MAG: alpha-amylase family glycosyl hydrolase, partial [Anaerolineae bacterium]|nr:alpha-amylase family glycosyl hydrolase [Anaerolineae bacterium]
GLIRAMRQVLDEYDDRMMVGEIYLPNEELAKYYGTPDAPECHLPFNFHLIHVAWNAGAVRRLVEDYLASIPAHGWPNWVLGNHDQHRLATRVGQDQARVANMLLLTLRGTPTCYYGDEIGMHDVPIPPEMVQDPPAVNQPEIAHIVGRDPERTPMQWDASPNAGFSPAGVRTWLPVADPYPVRNVAVQAQDPTSMLSFFRALTALRQSEPALTIGDFRSLDAGAADVFAYERRHGDSRLIVALNFTGEARRLDLSAVAGRGEVILSTEMTGTRPVILSALDLGPNEGVIVRIAA